MHHHSHSIHPFLIVGQGLVGSICAWQLEQRTIPFLVIDNNHFQSSSIIAAGLINPITGQRLVLQKDYTQYFQSAERLYIAMEKFFKTKLWTPTIIHRILVDSEEQEIANKRLHDCQYQNYIQRPDQTHNLIKPEFSTIRINSSAICHCRELLTVTKQWLLSSNRLIQEEFYDADLEWRNSTLHWKNQPIQGLILAQGHQGAAQSLSKHLKFNLVKGDILTLTNPQRHHLRTVLNFRRWLVPDVTNQTLRLGASFDWSQLEPSPNIQHKIDLLASMETYTKISPALLEHHSGIRPATKNQQPFIGRLHKEQPIYICNGFGTKGALMAPYLAGQMIDAIYSKVGVGFTDEDN